MKDDNSKRLRIGEDQSDCKVKINISISKNLLTKVDEFVKSLQEYDEEEIPTETLHQIYKRKRSGFFECSGEAMLKFHSLR